MARVRILLVGVMLALVALWSGDIFDRWVWPLVAAAVAPAVVAAVVVDRRWYVRAPAAVGTIVASVVAIAVVEGGGLSDAGVAATSGLRRLLSTEWPSPVRPDLVATVALVIAVCTALAAELASRPRLLLSPLLPVAAAALFAIALSAPAGPAALWPLLVGLIALTFAAIGSTGPLADRLRLLRGERRLGAMVLAIAAVTVVVSGTLSFTTRADPRSTSDPDRTAALLDPIEATLALQRIEPPVDLHVIELTDRADVPPRWRTAALADFDGRRWNPDLTLRPIGRRLQIDDELVADPLDAVVQFLDDDLQLVPLPGRPVVVDAEIETDLSRTLVRLVERPGVGDRIAVSSSVEPTSSSDLTGPIATREVDESVSSLADVAETLAADADGQLPPTVLERLRAIESTMRNDFVLDPDAPGGGLQRALIERFLRDTQRGNAEQFATAFVLLARSSGVDARVATGFEVEADRIELDGDTATFTLSSADAAIWPEVRSGDAWLAFDPVPARPLADDAPPPAEPDTQSPAAPQPPIAPPPDDVDEPVELADDDDQLTDSGVSTLVEFGIRLAAIGGLVLLPVLVVVGLVIGAKWRRRRRRLRGRPEQRIRGAWSEATDHLVDAGLSIGPAMTNTEIAQAGRPIAPTAGRELNRLSMLSTSVTFGDPARPDLLADDAAACLAIVERSVDQDRPWRARVRRRLSLRSLRRSTRSPV